MKLSISLADDDVEFLDRYADDHDMGSRSAVVQRAVRLLRTAELGAAYEAAWSEWEDHGDDRAWEAVSGDGVDG